MILLTGDLRRRESFDFHWLWTWSKIGFYSGLESMIKNVVYLIVVIRAMNLLNEQGAYWVANTFIWSWLLLPILPLGDLLKQDVGSSINVSSLKMIYWMKLLPYCSFTALWLLVWAISYPGWNWFIATVLNADKSEVNFICFEMLGP